MKTLVIILGDNWPEWIAVNSIVRRMFKQNVSCILIRTEPPLKLRKPKSTINGYYRFQAECLWEVTLPYLTTLSVSQLKSSSCLAPNHWAEIYRTKYMNVESGTNQQLIDNLAEFDFDICISLRPFIIFDKNMISFVERRGAQFWNMHTAPLPQFRGAAPLIHVYAEGYPFNEITLHEVDSGIDTGKIIAKKPLRLHRNKSIFQNYIAHAEPIADLVCDSILRHAAGRKTVRISQDEDKARYFSHLSEDKLNQYKNIGVRLIDSGDIVGAALHSVKPKSELHSKDFVHHIESEIWNRSSAGPKSIRSFYEKQI